MSCFPSSPRLVILPSASCEWRSQSVVRLSEDWGLRLLRKRHLKTYRCSCRLNSKSASEDQSTDGFKTYRRRLNSKSPLEGHSTDGFKTVRSRRSTRRLVRRLPIGTRDDSIAVDLSSHHANTLVIEGKPIGLDRWNGARGHVKGFDPSAGPELAE